MKDWKEKDWEEFLSEIKEKVSEALDYYCWNITGDTALDCYSAHQDLSLYELAEEFAEWERNKFGITKEDLERLREVPDHLYDKYTKSLQKEIRDVAKKLSRVIKMWEIFALEDRGYTLIKKKKNEG